MILLQAGLLSVNDVDIVNPELPFRWSDRDNFEQSISNMRLGPAERICVQSLESKSSKAVSEAFEEICNLPFHCKGLTELQLERLDQKITI